MATEDVYVLVGTLISGLILFLWLRPSRHVAPQSSSALDISVQVLVLGDIGRSPRMQYHALSIAQHGGRVDLIGYKESPILEELAYHERVAIFPLSPPPKAIRVLPFIISGPLKVIWQVYDLVVVLGWATKPARWLLLQNPPSIPTLALAATVSFARNTRLLIDWHNYGWSILAGTRGASHPFVAISKVYESFFGRLGSANLTVTKAMAKQLTTQPYRITSPISVMHDRPAAIFKPITNTSGRLVSLSKILESRQQATDIVEGRTKLIVSSTSWTPDEDFQLLLDALVQYAGHEKLPGRPRRSPILAVITGKGPQKAMYMAKIDKLRKEQRLENIEIRTAFLPMADYAALLACADLGVCLHMSSSGVDLPMKVVDMFGAGLPVVAYSEYESFVELVKDGVNGRGFKTSSELAEHLEWLLNGLGATELENLKEGAMRESDHRWSVEWDQVVAPILGFNDLET